MIIENIREEPREVDVWEMTFLNKETFQIMVDSFYGDSCQMSVDSPWLYFNLKERPSPVDPEATVAAEEKYIPVANCAVISKRKMIFEEPPLEQKEEWQQILREMVSTPGTAN